MEYNDTELFEKYLQTVEKHLYVNKTLTQQALITSAIVTSKKLIIEIESLEDIILKKQNKNNCNTLLILGAQLEKIYQEIKSFKQNTLTK